MDSMKHVEGFLTQIMDRYASYSTMRTYKYPLWIFTRYLEDNARKRLQDVTEEDLWKYRIYLEEKKLSRNATRVYVKAVKLYFRYLEHEGIIFLNPAENLQYPKKDRTMQPVPTEDEMKRLLDAIDTSTPTGIRDRAMLETTYSCGLRLEELMNLEINSIDFREKTARVMGKGKKERVLPLTKIAAEWLKIYMEGARIELLGNNTDDAALWISQRCNEGLTNTGTQKMVKAIAEKAGIQTEITMHSIRRATATHMLRAGATPLDIQELLGHSSLKSLGFYLRVTANDIRRMHANTRLGQ